ncbi:TRAP transporter small permease [uncultured Cohaesibacter sp.]|uniref:TRAP transporter small permease n=1 Tax=uncultured Cohaesibacter sp. TaxID=1002546 RepID=UPI0029C92985|nr:TRAP transporter small permease [uncultured Cohaesibacter sp.]
MKSPSRFLDLLEKALSAVCILCFFAMFVLGVATVVFRFIIESSLAFPDELIRYLFIWMIFLGSSVALRRGQHAAIGVLVKYLPDGLKRVALLLASLSSVFFFAAMFFYGLKLTMRVQAQISPALEVSMSWVYGAIPVGMAFLILFTLELILKELRTPVSELIAEG